MLEVALMAGRHRIVFVPGKSVYGLPIPQLAMPTESDEARAEMRRIARDATALLERLALASELCTSPGEIDQTINVVCDVVGRMNGRALSLARIRPSDVIEPCSSDEAVNAILAIGCQCPEERTRHWTDSMRADAIEWATFVYHVLVNPAPNANELVIPPMPGFLLGIVSDAVRDAFDARHPEYAAFREIEAEIPTAVLLAWTSEERASAGEWAQSMYTHFRDVFGEGIVNEPPAVPMHLRPYVSPDLLAYPYVFSESRADARRSIAKRARRDAKKATQSVAA